LSTKHFHAPHRARFALVENESKAAPSGYRGGIRGARLERERQAVRPGVLPHLTVRRTVHTDAKRKREMSKECNHLRGTGRTTDQIKSAPVGAVFVWCDARVGYPAELARKCRRTDIDVRPLSWLHPKNICGRKFSGVIVDHAARLDSTMTEALHMAKQRTEKEAKCS
jgi:hypothetical protein